MAGLTYKGLEIRSREEIEALLLTSVREELPGIDFSEGIEAALLDALAGELDLLWRTLEAVYLATDPAEASGVHLDMLAALTGTRRRAATRSMVTATLTIEAGRIVPKGTIVAVDGQADAQFRTVEAAVNAGTSTADVDVVMEGIETGPVEALAGTLTVIVTPVSGLLAATNAAAATLGRDVADDDELREQRLIELAGMGHGTYAAIRARVARVEGVQEAAVYGNESISTDQDGRPGKTFEVVLWDDSPAAAENDAIAQAIHDSKPAGIPAYGISTGNATDEEGNTVPVAFTRASKIRVFVAAELVLALDAPSEWQDLAVDAIVARGASYSVGETAYTSQLICALLEVPGVVAITSIAIDTSGPPAGASVAASYNEIVRIAAADVTITAP